MLKSDYLKNQKYLLRFLLHYCNVHKILSDSKKKKDRPNSLDISEFIDSENCAYLNAQKLLF